MSKELDLEAEDDAEYCNRNCSDDAHDKYCTMGLLGFMGVRNRAEEAEKAKEGIMSNATAVQRGCGSRVKGGVYMECGTSPIGLPLERFIVDPPRPIDPEALGVSPVGVTLIEVKGVTHVFDWIGSKHYANVADFVEEARRFGTSRRLPKNLDFSRLTSQSRMILIHARAYIGNYRAYLAAEPEGARSCPAAKHGTDGAEMCARYWWQDLHWPDGANGFDATNIGHEAQDPERMVTSEMPSFRYKGWKRPEGVTPEYRPAIFLSLPINRLVVVKSDDGSHGETAKRIEETAGLPVDVENE
jgi:hypothetical protein